jgi:thiamine phosphate synthase YjbQ (UPF0047 family)
MASTHRWSARLPAEFGHADITPDLEKFVSLSLPLIVGKLALGTWPRVVAINLDNRARDRELVAVLVG